MCGKVFTFYLFLVCFCQYFASNSCVSHILSAFCGRSQLRSYPKTVGCCKSTNTFIWNLTLKIGASILLASIVEPFSTLFGRIFYLKIVAVIFSGFVVRPFYLANSFVVVNRICSSLKHICDANYDLQASKFP